MQCLRAYLFQWLTVAFVMGSVRTRKGSNKLFIDFRYRSERCRELTALDDGAANRKKLDSLLKRIEAEITLGSFDYAAYFPGSKNLAKFAQPSLATLSSDSNKRGKSAFFKDFCEVWFQEMESSWRRSYRATVRGVLDRQLIPEFGDLEVSNISKADLLQFRASLAKVKHGNKIGFSADHTNRHIKIMKMILTEAADRFHFTPSFQNIKPLKVPKSDVDPFTLDEIQLFLQTIRPDFKDYFTVRFFTGMRTAEIDGLKWRFVDFERKQILVRETWVKGYVEYTKTDGGQREIEMNPLVYDALKNQFEATGDKEFVFTTKVGTPLCNNRVTKRVWHPLLAHLGMRPRRPYQTRHTAATLWLASGESPEWIARQMGHANTEMLFRVYSRYVPNLTRRDGSAFERLLSLKFSIDGGDHE
jgi:integrase